jgi:hypothetical protein
MIHQQNRNYFIHPVFYQEAAEIRPVGATKDMGYAAFKEHLDFVSWVGGLNLNTGKQLLREQKNSPDTLNQQIFGTTKDFNKVYAIADPWTQGQMLKAVMQAAEDAVKVMEPFIRVRQGAQGKDLVEAREAGVLALHLRNRDGKPFVHVHHVFHRAGMRQDGESRSLGRWDELMRTDPLAQRAFHYSLAWHLQRYAGIETDIRHNVCVIPGVPKDVVERLTSRQQASLDWIKAQPRFKGVEHIQNATDFKGIPPRWVDLGFIATQKPRKPFDHAKAHQEWRKEAEQATPNLGEQVKIPKGEGPVQFIKKTYENFIKEPWHTIFAAVRAGIRGDTPPQAVSVHNIDVFLWEVSKRPRGESHRYARHVIAQNLYSGVWDALKAGEKAYAEYRRPKQFIEKGAKIIVSHLAAPTPEQLDRLMKLAEKKGWTVEVEQKNGQRQQMNQKQQQTQEMK